MTSTNMNLPSLPSWRRLDILGFAGVVAGFMAAAVIGVLLFVFLLPVTSGVSTKLFSKEKSAQSVTSRTRSLPRAIVTADASEKSNIPIVSFGYAKYLTKGHIWQP